MSNNKHDDVKQEAWRLEVSLSKCIENMYASRISVQGPQSDGTLSVQDPPSDYPLLCKSHKVSNDAKVHKNVRIRRLTEK